MNDNTSWPRPWRRRAHQIWAATIALAVIGLLLSALMTEQPEGQCSGIGFGCTLSGTDLAALVAILVIPPPIVIQLLGHLIIGFLARIRGPNHRRPPRTDAAASARTSAHPD